MRSSLAIMWSARAAVCAGLTAALLPAQSAPATPPASTGASAAGAAARLQRVLDSLDALPGARLHVLVRHLEAGWEAGVRSDAPAPMASVYKLPIALGVLALADDGRGALTDTIRVEPRDFAPFWSPLAREAGERAARLSIDSALVLMVGLSDNTIADVLLANPGRDAINEALRRRRVQGVVVGDSERGMALRATGIGAWPAAVPWSPRAFDSVAATVPTATRAAARAAFLADPDNTASPRALVTLLAQLHGGALLLQPHTRRLLEILRASPTGAGKLRAGLPPGTPLAHKTGSGGDGIVSNDVGLVTLPDGGTLAIAAMVADYTLPDSSVDARIAAVARAAWAAATQPAPGAAPDGAHAQATGGGSGLRCREYVRCVLSVGDELETRRGLLTRQRVRTGPFLYRGRGGQELRVGRFPDAVADEVRDSPAARAFGRRATTLHRRAALVTALGAVVSLGAAVYVFDRQVERRGPAGYVTGTLLVIPVMLPGAVGTAWISGLLHARADVHARDAIEAYNAELRLVDPVRR